MRETQAQSLDRKEPLKKETATQFSALAWENPWTEENPWWATTHGVEKSLTQLDDHDNNQW